MDAVANPATLNLPPSDTIVTKTIEKIASTDQTVPWKTNSQVGYRAKWKKTGNGYFYYLLENTGSNKLAVEVKPTSAQPVNVQIRNFKFIC